MEVELQKIIDIINGPYSILAILFAFVWMTKNKSIVDLIKYSWNRNTHEISFITENINNLRDNDLEKEVFTEKRDQLVFRKLFGITANKQKRNHLIKLYQILEQEISLESICKAEKYILYRDNIYEVKKIPKLSKLKYYFNYSIFWVFAIFSFALMITISLSDKKNIIIPILVCFYIFGIGVFIGSGNRPIIYAKKIEKALANVMVDRSQPSHLKNAQ